MEYKDILYTKEDGIAAITLNRPDNRNAFTPEMTDSLHRAIDDAAKDNKVRVLTITGSGNSFCSGADVKAMAQRTGQFGGKPAEGRNIPMGLLLHKFPKPVLAAINGVAVGGGLGPSSILRYSDSFRPGQICRGLYPPWAHPGHGWHLLFTTAGGYRLGMSAHLDGGYAGCQGGGAHRFSDDGCATQRN